MNLKSTSKSGFTLVELLVTILIIVILSVTMLPLLKPFVTQAQYSAEGVPVIGNLRTKVELFRIENDYLPGVPIDAAGKVVNVSGKTRTTSDLSADTVGTEPTDLTDATTTWNGVQYLVVDDSSSAGGNVTTKYMSGSKELASVLGQHVWNRIDVNYSDLTGKKLRPQHIQYVVLKSEGDAYYWVVACLGDGSGLAKGCGYVVAEYNNPNIKRKFVATYENYKPRYASQLKLEANSSTGLGATDIDSLKLNGVIYLPALGTLEDDAGTTETTYTSALETMRAYGWQVN